MLNKQENKNAIFYYWHFQEVVSSPQITPKKGAKEGNYMNALENEDTETLAPNNLKMGVRLRLRQILLWVLPDRQNSQTSWLTEEHHYYLVLW